MSSRSWSSSSDPCADIVSARTENLERYIETRIALTSRNSRKYAHADRFAPLISMISLKVPPLGESIVEATVSRWLKKEGEAVASGETLVELETDKITVEVPAPRGGKLVKQSKNEGETVKVGEVLGEFEEGALNAPGGKSELQAETPSKQKLAASSEPKLAASSEPKPAAQSTTTTAATEVKSSPAARRVAADSGIDVASVSGSGRGGVVSKPDVLDAVAERSATRAVEPTPTPAPTAATTPSAPPFQFASDNGDRQQRETREKMSTRRKRIAENLLQSQHATAHLTTFNEIDMSAVNALRDRMKERVEKEHGTKLTFMPFFVKATCMALESFPVVNAQIDGDSIIYKHYVNMGIAVASDAGLVVPNIKDAHRKGTIELTRDISDVARRAREGKLTMEDLTGGTFTITNGGVFGSLVSTPIINYPQVGILGLHKTQDRPVAVGGRVEIRPMMYVALSYDHRIVDGQQAVLFLVRIKELIEDPAAMLVS
jgi:2-oxoglutarate dehydrogenase E2 component (dihydrolipoamide succinyltransferase)